MFTLIKKYWDKLPAAAQIVIVVLIAFGLYMGVRAIVRYYKKQEQQKVKENSTATADVNGTPVTVNLGTSATNIHAAFFDNDWFGISENESKALTELLNVPKKLIPNLSAVYYQLYSRNLKEDFQKYLSDEQYNQVSNYFNY